MKQHEPREAELGAAGIWVFTYGWESGQLRLRDWGTPTRSESRSHKSVITTQSSSITTTMRRSSPSRSGLSRIQRSEPSRLAVHDWPQRVPHVRHLRAVLGHALAGVTGVPEAVLRCEAPDLREVRLNRTGRGPAPAMDGSVVGTFEQLCARLAKAPAEIRGGTITCRRVNTSAGLVAIGAEHLDGRPSSRSLTMRHEPIGECGQRLIHRQSSKRCSNTRSLR